MPSAYDKLEAVVIRTSKGKYVLVTMSGYGTYELGINKYAFGKPRGVDFSFLPSGRRPGPVEVWLIGRLLSSGQIEWTEGDRSMLEDHGTMFDRLFVLLMDPSVPPKGARLNREHDYLLPKWMRRKERAGAVYELR